MRFTETELKGVFVIEPKVFGDNRGYFFESFRADLFRKEIGDVEFIQDNESKSARGVLRGLHYQLPPFAQSKLVRVIQGEVLDVAVDVRKGSPTFGKSVSEVLSAENKKQIFIPIGFAHGFLVLSDEAVFAYKVDALYSKESEAGIIYNDDSLNINWRLEEAQIKLSEKDKNLPILEKAELFNYGDEL